VTVSREPRRTAEVCLLARRVAQAIDAEEVIRLAQELVKIPSHYPGPGEGSVVDYLDQYLRSKGLRTHIHEGMSGRPNLIADVGQGTDGLIVEGHTDVVTPGDPARWSVPPYGGIIRDGQLFGRGAADMKGGIAAAVVASVAVSCIAENFRRPLRLALLADEEGMMGGVKSFIRDGYAAGFAGAIICEPQSNELCLWQKGAMRFRVEFRGKMAHGALPYTGKNPIFPASRFVEMSQSIEARLQAPGPHPYLGLPYVTPTVFIASAGEGQMNVIPQVAHVALDVRTTPGVDHQGVCALLQEALEDVRVRYGIDVEWELIEERHATATPRGLPVVRDVERAMELLGFPVRYGGVLGATDGTFLHAWAGLPVVVLGPGGREGPHQTDESVHLDQVVTAARIYAAAIILFCSREELT
jgi:succinyl-diaminopimelate desuccinylase